MVHEGPFKRARSQMLRLFQVGILERPVFRKSHMFFSEFVGTLNSWSGLKSSSSVLLSSASTYRSVDLNSSGIWKCVFAIVP